jgi:hypothetical protein
VGFFSVGGWSPVEASSDVVVAEPDDGVLAGEDGPEQGEVVGVERVRLLGDAGGQSWDSRTGEVSDACISTHDR